MKKKLLFTLLWAFYPLVICVEAQTNRTNTTNVQDMEIIYHTVESGQTVYSIAKMYDVMVMDIYKLNPGSDINIRTGERLRIPQRKFEVKSVLKVIDSKDDSDDYIIHTIQPNETIFGLAKRYNVNDESITRANPGLSQATFTIGKKIRIPKPVIQLPSAQVVERAGAKEVYYTVPTNETVYNVCRVYKTTEKELLQMNPELSGGLRAGMTIRIPLRISESELPKKVEPEAKTVTPSAKTVPKLVNAVKIAILLPFNADNPTSEISMQMAEYYSGILLALDTVLQQGFTMELFVYDIGDETNVSGTRRLLLEKNEELRKTNLIIGGYSTEQIKLIAAFAKQNEIKYVIPFFSTEEFVQDNAFVLQVNIPSNFLNAHAANAGANLFGKYHIIFLDTKDTLPQTEFIREFKQELKDRYISFSEAVYDALTFNENMLSLLSVSKPNLIIPVSQSKDAFLKIKPVLRLIAETQPELNLTLYGYPRWLSYMENFLEDFHALNTYIYSRFYVDNLHPDVKSFYDKYKSWFNRSPMQTYPQWAILGYDTGMYFFNALHFYGIHFEEKLSEMYYNNLQTGFNFIRYNEEGGFYNSNIYIIHFNKDYSIMFSSFR